MDNCLPHTFSVYFSWELASDYSLVFFLAFWALFLFTLVPYVFTALLGFWMCIVTCIGKCIGIQNWEDILTCDDNLSLKKFAIYALITFPAFVPALGVFTAIECDDYSTAISSFAILAVILHELTTAWYNIAIYESDNMEWPRDGFFVTLLFWAYGFFLVGTISSVYLVPIDGTDVGWCWVFCQDPVKRKANQSFVTLGVATIQYMCFRYGCTGRKIPHIAPYNFFANWGRLYMTAVVLFVPTIFMFAYVPILSEYTNSVSICQTLLLAIPRFLAWLKTAVKQLTIIHKYKQHSNPENEHMVSPLDRNMDGDEIDFRISDEKTTEGLIEQLKTLQKQNSEAYENQDFLKCSKLQSIINETRSAISERKLNADENTEVPEQSEEQEKIKLPPINEMEVKHFLTSLGIEESYSKNFIFRQVNVADISQLTNGEIKDLIPDIIERSKLLRYMSPRNTLKTGHTAAPLEDDIEYYVRYCYTTIVAYVGAVFLTAVNIVAQMVRSNFLEVAEMLSVFFVLSVYTRDIILSAYGITQKRGNDNLFFEPWTSRNFMAKYATSITVGVIILVNAVALIIDDYPHSVLLVAVSLLAIVLLETFNHCYTSKGTHDGWSKHIPFTIWLLVFLGVLALFSLCTLGDMIDDVLSLGEFFSIHNAHYFAYFLAFWTPFPRVLGRVKNIFQVV